MFLAAAAAVWVFTDKALAALGEFILVAPQTMNPEAVAAAQAGAMDLLATLTALTAALLTGAGLPDYVAARAFLAAAQVARCVSFTPVTKEHFLTTLRHLEV